MMMTMILLIIILIHRLIVLKGSSTPHIQGLSQIGNYKLVTEGLHFKLGDIEFERCGNFADRI